LTVVSFANSNITVVQFYQTKVSGIAKKQETEEMIEAKKNEGANALKEANRLSKEFGFTAGMLKGSLAEGRKKL
jgi:hypothetical protein